MRCPVDASFLSDHQYDDNRVAACHQCQGLWLRVTDMRNAGMRDGLAALVRPPRNSGAARTRSSMRHARGCPECRRPLVPQTIVGIEVDCCAACRGVWLDAGELPAIAAWHQRRALAPSLPAPLADVASHAVEGLVEAGATSVLDQVGEPGSAVVEFAGECLGGLFDGV